MTSPRHRVASRFVLCGALLGAPAATEANGWEHGTVPFEALVAALDAPVELDLAVKARVASPEVRWS